MYIEITWGALRTIDVWSPASRDSDFIDLGSGCGDFKAHLPTPTPV